MDIVKAVVRCEGEINVEWTITSQDGNETKFYSIENERPRHEVNDLIVNDKTYEILTKFLDNASTDEDKVMTTTFTLVSSNQWNISVEEEEIE